MEIHTSPSIIMRVKDFGESDLLVTFFTRKSGLLKGVAKGARRSRKRFVNCLDIFSLVNLEYRIKSKGDLHFIQSGKLIDAYSGIRSGFSALTKASYMIELTEALFPWELPDKNMFDILTKSFQVLALGEKDDIVTVVFEAMAMCQGGFGINLEKCCICGRRYTGEGTAVFLPEKGGIACLRCRRITAVNPQMGPETVRMLCMIQGRSEDVFDKLKDYDNIIEEITPVLKLHREYHLGRRLKTANYME